MWWEIILFSILGLTVIFTVSLIYGRHKWQAATKEMRADLEAARLPIGSGKYCPDDLIGLPAAVQRYFRTVLKDGQSMISSVSLEHIGTFQYERNRRAMEAVHLHPASNNSAPGV